MRPEEQEVINVNSIFVSFANTNEMGKFTDFLDYYGKSSWWSKTKGEQKLG